MVLKFDSSSHSCKIITKGQGSQIIDVVQRLKLVARQYAMLTREVLRKVMQKNLYIESNLNFLMHTLRLFQIAINAKA